MSMNTDTLRKAFIAWERQRVLYTVFIASFIAWKIGRFPLWPDPGLWNLLLLLVVVANVFYCVGPLIEIYALLFAGVACERARILLFGIGTLVSVSLLALVL